MNKKKVVIVGIVIVLVATVIGSLCFLYSKNHKKNSVLNKNTKQTATPTPTVIPVEHVDVTPVEEVTEEPTITPEPTLESDEAKKKATKTPKPTLKPELLKVTVKPNDVEDPGKTVSRDITMGASEKINFQEFVSSNEIEGTTNGIDVSSHNGKIDWKKVAATGVEFAIIRVGYRGWGAGTIVEDSQAKANIEGAIANGIKVGAYFFSTAISEEEAIDEALWTCNFISKYRVTYPVAYDCEQYNVSTHRNYSTTKTTRTDYALAFLNMVKEEGYTPMFYNSSYQLVHEWETNRIRDKYKIWKANYSSTEKYYFEKFSMHQYTSSGTVDGINGRVDLNTAYFGYKAEEEAKIAAYGMKFKDTNDIMYALEGARLRSVPSIASDDTIKYTMKKYEMILRTGIGDGAWDRIQYNGETVYVYKSNIITKEKLFSIQQSTAKPTATSTVAPTVTPSATVEPTSSATATSSPTTNPSENNTVEPSVTNEPVESKEPIASQEPDMTAEPEDNKEQEEPVLRKRDMQGIWSFFGWR